VHIDAAALSGTDQPRRCELEDGAPLAIEPARRLACDASIVSGDLSYAAPALSGSGAKNGVDT
jgi:hypothetical protein